MKPRSQVNSPQGDKPSLNSLITGSCNILIGAACGIIANHLREVVRKTALSNCTAGADLSWCSISLALNDSLKSTPLLYISFVLGLLLLIKNWSKIKSIFRSWRLGLISLSLLWSFLLVLSLDNDAPIKIIFLLLLYCEYLIWFKNGAAPPFFGDEQSRLFGHLGSNPIEDSRDDLLSRQEDVDRLSRVIKRREKFIALDGAWGSGKTSVVNLVTSRLREDAIFVRFDCWRLEGAGTMASRLADEIMASLKDDFFLISIEKIVAPVRSMAIADSHKGIFHLLFQQSESETEKLDRANSLLKLLDRPVVIVLDDLDRLQKDEIKGALRLIRQLGLLDNITVICCLSFKSFRSRAAESSEFLEKIFTSRIRLTGPPPSVIWNILLVQLSSSSRWQVWRESLGQDNGARVIRALKEIASDAPLLPIRGLRKLRIFVNDLENEIANSGLRQLNPIDVFVLRLIRDNNYKLYIALLRYIENIASGESIMNPANKDERARVGLDGVIEAIQASRNKVFWRTVLSRIFPDVRVYYDRMGTPRLKYRSELELLMRIRSVSSAAHAQSYLGYSVVAESVNVKEISCVLTRMSLPVSRVEKVIQVGEALDELASFEKECALWEEILLSLSSISELKRLRDNAYVVAMLSGRSVITEDPVAQERWRFAHFQVFSHLCDRLISISIANGHARMVMALMKAVVLHSPSDDFALRVRDFRMQMAKLNGDRVPYKMDSDYRLWFHQRMAKRYSFSNVSMVTKDDGACFLDSISAVAYWSHDTKNNSKELCHRFFEALYERHPDKFREVFERAIRYIEKRRVADQYRTGLDVFGPSLVRSLQADSDFIEWSKQLESMLTS